MTKRQSFSARFLYFVLLWCVFSYKVLLGGIGDAGIRIDDLLIVAAFVILAWRGDIIRVPRSGAFRAYLIFVLVNLCSAVWNGLAGRVAFVYSIIFVVRLLQYMVFYYLGYILLQNQFRVGRGLRIYFYVLCLVVPLQMFHLLPTPSEFNVSRASGNTNGPYELATVAAFFLCYLGYRNKERLCGAAAFVLMILTGARSTFVGVAISLVKVLVQRSSRLMFRYALIALPVVLIVALLVTLGAFRASDTSSDSILHRLSTVPSVGSMADVVAAYEAIPSYQNSGEYSEGVFLYAITLIQDSEGDASGQLRVFRWAALLKSAFAHFDTTLIGLGPSFGTSAVDGYFVRVFVETGVIGLGFFLWFVWTLLSRNGSSPWQFREFVFILLVTAVSIDIFVSYKTMLFLWLWHGMNEYQVSKGTNANRIAVGA